MSLTLLIITSFKGFERSGEIYGIYKQVNLIENLNLSVRVVWIKKEFS